MQHLAVVGGLRADGRDAARLIGYVDARFKDIGYERDFTGLWDYEKLMAALHENLSDADIERLTAEGAKWSEDQAIEASLKV